MTRGAPAGARRAALVLLGGALLGLTPLGTARGQEPAGGDPAVRTVPYAVRSDGGPEGLAELIARAFAAWTEAVAEAGGVRIEAVPQPDAPAAVAWGDPALLGPDALSLTVRQEDGVTVLLDPRRAPGAPAVALHEAGALLGLEPGGPGAMAHAVGADASASPSGADAAALAERLRVAPEDVTRDGLVDVYDLAAVAAAWGQRGVNLPADIDGDGVVDEADLERLRSAYRFDPPARAPAAEPSTPGASVPGAPGAADPEAPGATGDEAGDPAAAGPEDAPEAGDEEGDGDEPEGDPDGDPDGGPADPIGDPADPDDDPEGDPEDAGGGNAGG